MSEYAVRLKPRAQNELERLDRETRQRVIAALERLKNGLQGDVKRLTSFTPEYRLRVGDYRILFEVEHNIVIVYRICPRRDAYR